MADRERILALQQRSFDLACSVINAFPKQRFLDNASRIVWHQLIKAVTSSTFNLEEADAASSDADFLAKMRIALREAKETTPSDLMKTKRGKWPPSSRRSS